MKMYFYSKSNEKVGPVTFDELIKMNLTEKALIWRDGLANWIPAGEVEELKDYIIKEPPPLPSEKREFKIEVPDLKYDKTYKRSFTKIIILFVAIFISYPLIIIIADLMKISINKVYGIFALLTWVFSLYFTVRKAEKLNRRKLFWGIIGSLFPVLSLIIMMCSKKYLFPPYYIEFTDHEKSTTNLVISYTYLEKGLKNEAIYFANKAYEINPKNVEALYTRGEVYYLLGEKDLAISDIESYIELGNPRKKAYRILSEIYNQKGDIIKSKYYLEKG